MPSVIIAPEQLPPWVLRTEIPTVVADQCEDACDLAVWRAIRWLISLSGQDRFSVDARTIAAHAKVDVKTALRCIHGDRAESRAKRRPRNPKRGLVGLGLLEVVGTQSVGKLNPRPVYRIPRWIEERNAHDTQELLARLGMNPAPPAPSPDQAALPLNLDPHVERGAGGPQPPPLPRQLFDPYVEQEASDFRTAPLPRQLFDPHVEQEASDFRTAPLPRHLFDPHVEQGRRGTAPSRYTLSAQRERPGPIADQPGRVSREALDPKTEQTGSPRRPVEQKRQPDSRPPDPKTEQVEAIEAHVDQSEGTGDEMLDPKLEQTEPHVPQADQAKSVRSAALDPKTEQLEAPGPHADQATSARSGATDPKLEQETGSDEYVDEETLKRTLGHYYHLLWPNGLPSPDPDTDQRTQNRTARLDPNSARWRDGRMDGGGEGGGSPPLDAQSILDRAPAGARPQGAPARGVGQVEWREPEPGYGFRHSPPMPGAEPPAQAPGRGAERARRDDEDQPGYGFRRSTLMPGAEPPAYASGRGAERARRDDEDQPGYGFRRSPLMPGAEPPAYASGRGIERARRDDEDQPSYGFWRSPATPSVELPAQASGRGTERVRRDADEQAGYGFTRASVAQSSQLPPRPPREELFTEHKRWVPGLLPAHPLDLWRRACSARRQIDDDQLAMLASEHDQATGGYGWYWVGRAILAAAITEDIHTVAKVRRTMERWRTEDSYGSDAPEGRRSGSSSGSYGRSGRSSAQKEKEVPLSVRLGLTDVFKEI